MQALFDARLVNPSFGDPGVCVDFRLERRSLLFDLGDNAPLLPRTLMRISHVFVSHTHMDHFIGFDRLLRIFLGHANHVLTRDQLMVLSRGRDSEPFERSIDLQVSRLRHRLGDDPANPQIIKTVRGEGYVLAVPVKVER